MNSTESTLPFANTDHSMAEDNAPQYGRHEQDVQFDGALVVQKKDGSEAISAPNARLLITGGSTRWNTGFPDWANKESYGGTLRIQNKDTGEQMICSYIENSTKADCSIVDGEIPGRLLEARDTDTVGYGADARVVDGHHAWSTWVKFHYQDWIYSARVTCFC